MRINNNVAAYNAYRNLATNGTAVSKSLEKLSSGLRINRAADDAAGLVVSQKLRAQMGGLTQATRNAQDGISVVQTAEGALNEVHNMLGRMRDLAVQAANTGSNDDEAVAAAQGEVDKLLEEIDQIADTTKFGSVELLKGGYGVSRAKVSGVVADAANADVWTPGHTIDVTIGAETVTGIALTAPSGTTATEVAEHLQNLIRGAFTTAGHAAEADSFKVEAQTVGGGAAITFSSSEDLTFADNGAGTALADLGVTDLTDTASGTGGVFQVGANKDETIEVSVANIKTTDVTGLNLDRIKSGNSLKLDGNAGAAIEAIDEAIKFVSTTRAGLGATQNRFESVISNLQVTTENLTASESRIRDTDYSSEMVKFTKGQILNQAATSMLGQANRLSQGVMGLLQG